MTRQVTRDMRASIVTACSSGTAGRCAVASTESHQPTTGGFGGTPSPSVASLPPREASRHIAQKFAAFALRERDSGTARNTRWRLRSRQAALCDRRHRRFNHRLVPALLRHGGWPNPTRPFQRAHVLADLLRRIAGARRSPRCAGTDLSSGRALRTSASKPLGPWRGEPKCHKPLVHEKRGLY